MGLLGRQRAYAQYQHYASMNKRSSSVTNNHYTYWDVKAFLIFLRSWSSECFKMLTDVQTIALLRPTAASGSSILRLGGQPGGCWLGGCQFKVLQHIEYVEHPSQFEGWPRSISWPFQEVTLLRLLSAGQCKEWQLHGKTTKTIFKLLFEKR